MSILGVMWHFFLRFNTFLSPDERWQKLHCVHMYVYDMCVACACDLGAGGPAERSE